MVSLTAMLCHYYLQCHRQYGIGGDEVNIRWLYCFDEKTQYEFAFDNISPKPIRFSKEDKRSLFYGVGIMLMMAWRRL